MASRPSQEAGREPWLEPQQFLGRWGRGGLQDFTQQPEKKVPF